MLTASLAPHPHLLGCCVLFLVKTQCPQVFNGIPRPCGLSSADQSKGDFKRESWPLDKGARLAGHLQAFNQGAGEGMTLVPGSSEPSQPAEGVGGEREGLGVSAPSLLFPGWSLTDPRLPTFGPGVMLRAPW